MLSLPSPPSSMLWTPSRPRMVPLSLRGWPWWWPIWGQPSWLAIAWAPPAASAAVTAQPAVVAPSARIALPTVMRPITTPSAARRPGARTSVRCSDERPGKAAGSRAAQALGSASAPAGHRRQDHERVAIGDGGVQPVEHPHVLVVEIDVDVAVQRAVGCEQLALGRGVRGGEVAQHVADVGAGRADLLLAAHGSAQDRWDLDRGHEWAQPSR